MTALPTNWHHSPQARALIARCKEGEFFVDTVVLAAWDEEQFFGLTDAAERKLARLTALRDEAVSKAVGFTFGESQKRDPSGGLSAQWVNACEQCPNVHVVLRDTFAARRVQQGEAA